MATNRNAGWVLLGLAGWLWMGAALAVAQIPTTTLMGRTFDAKTGEPLPFATVYINNSSRGTTADDQGQYRLTGVPLGNHELVGSALGYTVARQAIRLAEARPRTIDLRLQPTDQALAAVTVTARHSSAWARQYRTFSRELFGTRPQARQCRILNPNVLSFVDEKGHLRAQASEPLVIENAALGYQLTYNLLHFDLYGGKMQFAGTARFEELPTTDARQKALWQANRTKAYQGSLQHLLVNLLAGTHEAAGYVVYRSPLTSNPGNVAMPIVGIGDRQYIGREQALALFKPAGLPFERRLESNWPLEVYYNRVYASNSPYRDLPYAYSLLLFPNGLLDLTTNGGITQGNGLDVRGYLGNDRLATLLPTDWAPAEADMVKATDIITGRPTRADAGLDSLVVLQQRQAERTAPLVFVHTDKTLYCTGDRLWCSAYVLDPTRLLPLAGRNETALQIELVAPTGRVVQHQWLRLTDGRAATLFRLADTLSAGMYRLRAYTAFDQVANGPAFDWAFPVYNAGLKSALLSVTDETSATATVPVAASTNRPVDVQFLPEGGRWLAGVPGQLGIKAIGPNGRGYSVSGRIVDQAGTDVVPFTTNPFGMGQVTLTPQAGQRYTALISTPSGDRGQSVMLPEAEAEGWALAVDPLTDSSRLNVRLRATGHYGQQPVYVTLHSREQLVYTQKWTLKDGEGRFALPTASLPQGVCRLTLWDATNQPRAERLVFVTGRPSAATTRISLSKPHYEAREQVAIGLQFRDEAGYPVLGTWSVAVTDADQLPPDTTGADIRTHLLLTAGLRGPVESPAYYLEKNHEPELDNLLLTQGWRRLPAPAGVPSPEGWTLSGHVRDRRGKPMVNAAVVMQLEQEGEKVMRSLLTDAGGSFRIDGLPNSDTLLVRASVPGAAGLGAVLTVDSPGGAFPIPPTAASAWSALRPWLLEAQTRQAAWPALYRDSTARQLAEVVIKATKPRSERPLDVQRSSLHSQPDGVLVVDPIVAASALTLNDLIRRVPGVIMIGDEIRLGGISTFGDQTPLFLVDGVYVDAKVLTEINPLLVERIELVKFVMASVYGARGANGVIAIYLKKGEKGVPTVRTGVTAQVPGFVTAREFYTPRYEAADSEGRKDRRDVLYWNALMQNDANGQARLLFPLSDVARRLRLVIQGVTGEGVPISATWEVPVR